VTALAILNPPAAVPVCPPALAQNLASFDGMQIVRGQVPALVVAQARSHLAALERYHAPPPLERIELWCRELRRGLAPISDQEFADRLAAIQADFAGFPGWVWNLETLSTMRRRQRFFPLSCDIEDVFGPLVFAKNRGISQVRLLASATPAPADDAPKVDISGIRNATVSRFQGPG
jgi:hypothetical protein